MSDKHTFQLAIQMCPYKHVWFALINIVVMYHVLQMQDIDKTTGSERSNRPTRAVSPGPQIKIKVRDREDTPSQSQTLPSNVPTGSPSHSTPITPRAVPATKLKQGNEVEPRGRGSPSTGRLYSPGQRVTGGQMPGISIEGKSRVHVCNW